MTTLPVHNVAGFSVLAILVAVMILAAVGTALTLLVASNQESRVQQIHYDQAFASAQGGLEFALGEIYAGVNPCTSLNSSLLGDSLLSDNLIIERISDRVIVTGMKGGSSVTISVVDPIPPAEGQYLGVDVSQAKDASNGAPPRKLSDITFQLTPGCGLAVTIISLTMSWSPNYGEGIVQIKFDGSNVYSGDALLSGGTVDIVDQAISDANVHLIDFIRWDADIQNRLYTIQFNFADGSNKVVTVDTR